MPGCGTALRKLLHSSSGEGCLVTLFLFLDGGFAPTLGMPGEGLGLACYWWRRLLVSWLQCCRVKALQGRRLPETGLQQLVPLQVLKDHHPRPPLRFSKQYEACPCQKQALRAGAVVRYASQAPLPNYSRWMPSSDFPPRRYRRCASALASCRRWKGRSSIARWKASGLKGLSAIPATSTSSGRVL